MALIFEASSATSYPGIAYTGCAAAGVPGSMGQDGSGALVVLGPNTNTSGVWSPNASC